MALKFVDLSFRVTVSVPEPTVQYTDIRQRVSDAVADTGWEVVSVVPLTGPPGFNAMKTTPACQPNAHSAGWYMGQKCTRCGDVD